MGSGGRAVYFCSAKSMRPTTISTEFFFNFYYPKKTAFAQSTPGDTYASGPENILVHMFRITIP
jgi:hypothetical protein